MENYCFDCYKWINNSDMLNVKCTDCNKWICDNCIEGDLLGGLKCRRCDIKFVINRLTQLHESTYFLNLELRCLKNKEKKMKENRDLNFRDECSSTDSED